jgi:hypothetical protein
MKRIVLAVLLFGFVMGCGQSAVQSEYYQHSTMYKSWDHLKFSWAGHKNPTEEDVKLSQQQDWWGMDIPHIPGN